MRIRKQVLAMLLTAAMVVTGSFIPGQSVQKAKADSASSFESLNQSEITDAMGAGWNLGNQLEASSNGTPDETCWGNPVITEDLILAVKDAGFKSIRIPVSYLSKIGNDADYTIDTAWLNRVQEVVDLCIDNGLYAIINMHGDGYTTINGGWLLCGNSDQTTIKEKYKACWEQIATKFKGYDEHLVFESMNEEFNGSYSNPDATAYANINAYNQIFVDTVRQTGGNNDGRWLLIPGWNTNINYTADDYGFVLPTDTYRADSIPSDEQRIMISAHYYDPWDFCGTESSAVTQWGDTVTDSSKVASWGDETYMKSQLKKMHDTFVSKGYPVVIGEYGSIDKSTADSTSNANRAEYAGKLCYYCNMYGLIPEYWDNGYNGNYGFGLFDRYNYKVTQQGIIDAIMEIYGDDVVATATGITLDQTSLTIKVGDAKKTLNATLTPATSADKITWTSSDEDIATVNPKGQVTAVSTGSCTITATVPLGATASCQVTVPRPDNIHAKLYLLETSSWKSVISDDYVEINPSGGSYSLSLNATETQLKNIGSLYIRDVSVGDNDSSAFDYAKVKVNSIVVNGTTFAMNEDSYTYDTSLAEGSSDGLSNPIFNFAFINVWASTHVKDVTVESWNYKAYFNNISYATDNDVTVNFEVSDIQTNGSSATTTPVVSSTPTPTATSVATPTTTPTTEPTETPVATPAASPKVTATPAPTSQVSSDDVEAVLSVTADWGQGGLGNIVVKNTTGKDFLNGWAVTFHVDRPIASCWSGVLTDLGDGDYQIANPSWSNTLLSGDSVTLSFQMGEGTASPTLSQVKLVEP